MIELISSRLIMYEMMSSFLIYFLRVFNCDYIFFLCFFFFFSVSTFLFDRLLICWLFHITIDIHFDEFYIELRIHFCSHCSAHKLNFMLAILYIFFYAHIDRLWWTQIRALVCKVKYVINVIFISSLHSHIYLMQFVHSDNTFNCHRKLKMKHLCFFFTINSLVWTQEQRQRFTHQW